MLVPVLVFEFWWVLGAFLVLEAMVGVFSACGATLRSKYFPDAIQSSVMTVFRLPLNLLVVLGTRLTDKAGDAASLQFVFFVVVGMHCVAMLLQLVLLTSYSTHLPIQVEDISSSQDNGRSKKLD